MQRLQFTQELSNLELRLATIQGEIRTLNRMSATKVTKQQLRQLRGQEIGIESRIAEVHAILNPALPAPPPVTKSTGGGCGTILAWVFLFPIMLSVKLISSPSKPIRITGYVTAGFFALWFSLAAITKPSTTRSQIRATPAKVPPVVVSKQISVAASNTTIAQTAVSVHKSSPPVTTPEPPTPRSAPPTDSSILPTPTPKAADLAAQTAMPSVRGQMSYGQQVLDLFTQAGLEISSATKAEVNPKDPLPDTYVERWEFVVAEVAPKGGQIFICEQKTDCDVLINYFTMLRFLAGPNLFQSPSGLVIAQLNSGLSPETAAKFKAVIYSRER